MVEPPRFEQLYDLALYLLMIPLIFCSLAIFYERDGFPRKENMKIIHARQPAALRHQKLSGTRVEPNAISLNPYCRNVNERSIRHEAIAMQFVQELTRKVNKLEQPRLLYRHFCN